MKIFEIVRPGPKASPHYEIRLEGCRWLGYVIEDEVVRKGPYEGDCLVYDVWLQTDEQDQDTLIFQFSSTEEDNFAFPVSMVYDLILGSPFINAGKRAQVYAYGYRLYQHWDL